MPSNYPKAQHKKIKPKKTKPKAKITPVSITTRKSYWVTLTLTIAIFASGLGYFLNMPLENIVMMLVTVLLLIGFVFYIRFKPSTITASKRATFIFVGASFIGFSIWAIMILSLSTMTLNSQVASLIGDNLFVTTSLIICLISGAFFGDVISRNRERISIFIDNKLRK